MDLVLTDDHAGDGAPDARLHVLGKVLALVEDAVGDLTKATHTQNSKCIPERSNSTVA